MVSTTAAVKCLKQDGQCMIKGGGTNDIYSMYKNCIKTGEHRYSLCAVACCIPAVNIHTTSSLVQKMETHQKPKC